MVLMVLTTLAIPVTTLENLETRSSGSKQRSNELNVHRHYRKNRPSRKSRPQPRPSNLAEHRMARLKLGRKRCRQWGLPNRRRAKRLGSCEIFYQPGNPSTHQSGYASDG